MTAVSPNRLLYTCRALTCSQHLLLWPGPFSWPRPVNSFPLHRVPLRNCCGVWTLNQLCQWRDAIPTLHRSLCAHQWALKGSLSVLESIPTNRVLAPSTKGYLSSDIWPFRVFAPRNLKKKKKTRGELLALGAWSGCPILSSILNTRGPQLGSPTGRSITPVLSMTNTQLKTFIEGKESGQILLFVHGWPDDHTVWDLQVRIMRAWGLQAKRLCPPVAVNLWGVFSFNDSFWNGKNDRSPQEGFR